MCRLALRATRRKTGGSAIRVRNQLLILFLTPLYSHRRIFPGGCFFATVAAQLAPRPGRVRDRVMQLQALWVAQFTRALHQARLTGDLPRDTDLNQLAFEITAMLFRANFAWIVSEDESVLDHARVGVKHVLAYASRESSPRQRRARKP